MKALLPFIFASVSLSAWACDIPDSLVKGTPRVLSREQLAVDSTVPNPVLTPGIARTDLTQAQICSRKWGKDARHVTETMKRQVFANYGFSGNDDPRCVSGGKQRCEIDHLISRELGGADDVRNLWPQPYGSKPWNAHLKDKLENRLHKELCVGHITLKAAQDMLVNDWRSAYRKYYGEPK